MIETITLRKQTPSEPNGWLYEETGNGRVFKKIVCLGDNATPWHECTDDDKAAYEAQWAIDHPEVEEEKERIEKEREEKEQQIDEQIG